MGKKSHFKDSEYCMIVQICWHFPHNHPEDVWKYSLWENILSVWMLLAGDLKLVLWTFSIQMASHVLSGECFQLLVESDLQRIKTALKKKGVQACFLTGHRRILCQTLISCCCQLSFERRKLQCAILAHKVQLFSLMFLFLIKKVNETHLVCIIICSGESCKGWLYVSMYKIK